MPSSTLPQLSYTSLLNTLINATWDGWDNRHHFSLLRHEFEYDHVTRNSDIYVSLNSLNFTNYGKYTPRLNRPHF